MFRSSNVSRRVSGRNQSCRIIRFGWTFECRLNNFSWIVLVGCTDEQKSAVREGECFYLKFSVPHPATNATSCHFVKCQVERPWCERLTSDPQRLRMGLWVSQQKDSYVRMLHHCVRYLSISIQLCTGGTNILISVVWNSQMVRLFERLPRTSYDVDLEEATWPPPFLHQGDHVSSLGWALGVHNIFSS